MVGPGREVVVQGLDQVLQRAVIRQRLPALAAIPGETIGTGAEGSKPKAGICAVLVGPSHDHVAGPRSGAQTSGDRAGAQQSLPGRHDRRQPPAFWPSASRGHRASVPTRVGGAIPAGSATGLTSGPSTVRTRRVSRMAGCAPMIVLPAAQQQHLTAWARAGTTPQRLVRRARVLLGSAAGLGSRRLAQQERMSRTTVQRWRARLLAAGCAGLQDRPRRGRPPEPL